MTNGNNNDQLKQITQNLATITSTLGTLSNGVIENREYLPAKGMLMVFTNITLLVSKWLLE